MVFAVVRFDWKIVDAGDAPAHQPMLVELPVLVAIAAEPVIAVVMPFISEAHSDAVLAKGPEFLDESVIEFAVPFARQKRFDGATALDEFRAIAPAAVGRVGRRNPHGIAGIPSIFRQTHFLGGRLPGEVWQWQSGHWIIPCLKCTHRRHNGALYL